LAAKLCELRFTLYNYTGKPAANQAGFCKARHKMLLLKNESFKILIFIYLVNLMFN